MMELGLIEILQTHFCLLKPKLGVQVREEIDCFKFVKQEGNDGVSYDFRTTVPAILFFQGNFDVKFPALPFHFFAKFEMRLYNGNICNLLQIAEEA